MPAVQRYPAPHEQLLALAKAARKRGLSFEQFWSEAVRPDAAPITTKTPTESVPAGAIIWSRDHSDRTIAMNAMNASRDDWKRAYENRPPTRKVAALLSLDPAGDSRVGA